jgi:hypothetical protein
MATEHSRRVFKRFSRTFNFTNVHGLRAPLLNYYYYSRAVAPSPAPLPFLLLGFGPVFERSFCFLSLNLRKWYMGQLPLTYSTGDFIGCSIIVLESLMHHIRKVTKILPPCDSKSLIILRTFGCICSDRKSSLV